MAGLHFDDHTSVSFKKFGILKIYDLMKVQYASLMWDYDHGSLPQVFQGFFTKISDVHSHHTRSSASDDLAKTIYAKTIHGNKLFKIIGVNTFNEINKLPFYRSSRTRQCFLNHYKKYLIEKY